jgi:hypothetical protein
MNMATDFYSARGWTVEHVHGTQRYDLICRRGHEVKYVEVKGTTTDGAEVILPPSEVRHARENECTALFVLSNITIGRAEDGTVTAAGGQPHRYDPWRLDDGTLTPWAFFTRSLSSGLRMHDLKAPREAACDSVRRIMVTHGQPRSLS